MAVEAFRNAAALKPQEASFHDALGTALTQRDRFPEAELSLLKAMALGEERALEQLRKMWDRAEYSNPTKFGWKAACSNEVEGRSGPWIDALQQIRAKEMEEDWQSRRLASCADEVLKGRIISCSYSTVFLEGWQAAWVLVEKLAKKPRGRHVVIGGGLGALCRFSLHVGSAAECVGFEQSC